MNLPSILLTVSATLSNFQVFFFKNKLTFFQFLHLTLGAELSPEECKSLGFSSLSLSCSSCDDFARFSVSAAQVSDCRKCCRDEGRKLDVRDSKYPKAILEVCG